jgi:hypothetical protein
MTNHVHLLLTPARTDSVGLLMKHLGQRYVQYINRSYRRSGTLWEGRFRSCLAQSEDYVLACYRYIELNPVRANMVAHPRDYRFSSYRANAEGDADSGSPRIRSTCASAAWSKIAATPTGNSSRRTSIPHESPTFAALPTATTCSAASASRRTSRAYLNSA